MWNFIATLWLSMASAVCCVLLAIMVPRRMRHGHTLLDVLVVSIVLGALWPITVHDLWEILKYGKKKKG